MTRHLGATVGIAIVVAGTTVAWAGAERIGAAGALREIQPSQQQAATIVEATLLAAMPRAVRESSGLVISDRYPVFWTHNDSGDGPVLYAVDSTGAIVGRARIARVKARDFEDLGKGRCPSRWSHEPYCLYVADTGNNDRSRRVLSIYVLAEPQPGSDMAEVEAGRLRFSYPDQRSDVEALAVAPNGDLLLVSKGRRGGVRGYRIPVAEVERALDTEDLAEVEALGILPFEPSIRHRRLITGGTYADSLLVLRTYEGIYGFRYEDGTWISRGACTIRPQEPAGEAIAYASGNRFLLSSEAGPGRYPSLHWTECRLEQ